MLSRQTQCDQLLKYKVAKSYPKVSTAVFNIKIAQKQKLHIWAIFARKCVTKPLNNSPIRSHWVSTNF